MGRKINPENQIQVMERLQEVIGYVFKEPLTLREALTHSSYANEHRHKGLKDNERLEFLGDAILDLIISEYLFRKCKAMPEGDLSKIRASIVCEGSLAQTAKILQLGDYLQLGKGEEMTGGKTRASLLADAFEALTGAIFLDGGFEQAKAFLEKTLVKEVEKLGPLEDLYKDYKTLLQEHIQKESTTPLIYEVTGEDGPDHDKNFYVEVYHDTICLGKGVGKSKKEAEQDAAKRALYTVRH
ncbi:ribonuclease III [Sporanaerobium hydrogeniformans]|uniref:Ribonuclease III n=1 Tax=Sporanaerobium hydrogeniformans TaxID=3072179 RepID=A0AC61DDV8_9FIRM|nr:ribonuclease III [Sporanaerobium hydrogeniformans]PHV71112.1 ribonuclease III [Sporanaerobium hydrogeniformans]